MVVVYHSRRREGMGKGDQIRCHTGPLPAAETSIYTVTVASQKLDKAGGQRIIL